MERPYYSIIIAAHPTEDIHSVRLGEISVDWVDFTRQKSIDRVPSPTMKGSRRRPKPIPGDGNSRIKSQNPEDLSLQPLLGHVPGPHPLETSSASGISTFGRGIVHLFKHAPPPHLIASIDAHPIGESSKSVIGKKDDWSGEKAEGEDGSLVAILAVPAWMRPADFLEFIGGWATCLEGVRMIRWVFLPLLSSSSSDSSPPPRRLY